VRPGDKDTLVVGSDATKITYTASREESPTLEVGVSDHRADYAFEIAGVDDQPGSTITLGLPTEGNTLTLHNLGATGTSSLDLTMTRLTEQGVGVFHHLAIPLVGSDTAQLQFGSWTTANEGIPLVTTHDGHRSTEVLSDQGTGQ
jgi:hypothetical protein